MYDYTCIEILEDDFKDDEIEYFKLNKNFDEKDIPIEIYVLQFPQSEELSFSLGQILKVENSYIIHTASTEGGSSGSPIIKREDHSVIGLHFGGNKNYNKAFKLEDILTNIMNIYSNIDIIHNYIKKEKLLNSKSLNYSIIRKYKSGKLGNIYIGSRKEMKKDLLIISINLFKLYEISKDIKILSEEINKNIDICRLFPSNDFDYFINGNNINIIIEKYKIKFTNYFEEKNNDFNFDEINNFNGQLKNFMKIINKNNIYLGTINIDNILISKINDDKIKYQFLFFYDKIILNDNKMFLSPELIEKKKDYSKSDLWSIGILFHFILSKAEYPLNFYTTSQFIENIKNNSFKLDSKNIENNLPDLIQLLLKYKINDRISWNDYFNFFFEKKGYKNE